MHYLLQHFSHTIQSSDRFEFSISPAMNSSLPILWQPNVHSLCTSISLLPLSHPPIAMPKCNSKLQQIANCRMAHSRTPLDPIYEHSPIPTELTPMIAELSPFSKTFVPSKQLVRDAQSCISDITSAPHLATIKLPIQNDTPIWFEPLIPDKVDTIPDNHKVTPVQPDDTLICHIPMVIFNFTSLSHAPYPPCPSTHINQLSPTLPTPPFDPILTSIYGKHNTSPYLKTINFNSDAFSSIPLNLLDRIHSK